ncbi:MAG: hypothetical protein IH861_09460 [Chloroflexi bacterium]|nr:hypothetical protein [Chloroflexota bacterium]
MTFPSIRFIAAILILSATLLVAPRQAQAQTPSELDVTMTAGTSQLTVGDPVTLTVLASYPSGYTPVFPKVPAKWGELEVKDQSAVQYGAGPAGTQTAQQEIVVTLFSFGAWDTPEFTVTFVDFAGETEAVSSAPVTLEVLSLLPEGADQLRDIRPQASVHFPFLQPWMIVGLVGLGMAFVGILAYVILPAWRWAGVRFQKEKELPTPFQLAHDEFREIETSDLPGRGLVADHYALVSGVVRRYLEREYEVSALDHTTREIGVALELTSVPSEDIDRITQLLAMADHAKFARFSIEIESARDFTRKARDIVEVITPVATWTGREGGQVR